MATQDPLEAHVSAQPTPAEIAQLAIQFIPALLLPDGWDTMNPQTLMEALGEATTGKGRNYAKDYEYPPGWATPFEIVAEEATRRARILLDAAAGRVRPERLDYTQAGERAREQLSEYGKAAAELQRKFDRFAKEGTSLSIMDALKHALPNIHRRRPDNPFRYWREYLRDDIVSRRQKEKLPAIDVHFSDEATSDQKACAVEAESPSGPPACIVLRADQSYQVTRTEFPRLVLGLADFYRLNGKTLQKQWAKSAGRKGGKKSQAKKRPGKFSQSDARKLTNADKKLQKMRRGA